MIGAIIGGVLVIGVIGGIIWAILEVAARADRQAALDYELRAAAKRKELQHRANMTVMAALDAEESPVEQCLRELEEAEEERPVGYVTHPFTGQTGAV